MHKFTYEMIMITGQIRIGLIEAEDYLDAVTKLQIGRDVMKLSIAEVTHNHTSE